MNKTRKFDGKVYTYQETSIKSKADADKYANKLRSQGHKVRNLTINGLAIELRAGRVKRIESSSVFDRAIYTIMSKVQH